MEKDPLDVVFETPEQSLAHYLNAMPKSLAPVFQREFMRRPTLHTADGANCPSCQAESVIVGTQCLVCGVFSPRH